MNKKNIGGRPTKSSTEKRTYRVNVKMNTEEYYTLKGRAKKAGITACELIRKVIMNTEIKQRLSTESMDCIRKISGIANNLNQIAHCANAAGYKDARTEYLYLADKIDNILKQIKQ